MGVCVKPENENRISKDDLWYRSFWCVCCDLLISPDLCAITWQLRFWQTEQPLRPLCLSEKAARYIKWRGEVHWNTPTQTSHEITIMSKDDNREAEGTIWSNTINANYLPYDQQKSGIAQFLVSTWVASYLRQLSKSFKSPRIHLRRRQREYTSATDLITNRFVFLFFQLPSSSRMQQFHKGQSDLG